MSKPKRRYFVCVHTEGAEDLELRKLYEVKLAIPNLAPRISCGVNLGCSERDVSILRLLPILE